MAPLGDLWTDMRLLDVGNQVVYGELQGEEHPLARRMIGASLCNIGTAGSHRDCRQFTCRHTSAAYRLTTPFHHSGHCRHNNSKWVVTSFCARLPEMRRFTTNPICSPAAAGAPPTDMRQW